VSSSFSTAVFFSGGLPFSLYLVRLRVVVQLSLLSRYSMRVALLFGPLALRLLPRLLSHWSGSRTVPLTLVLRHLASAELQLYRTISPT
jgi:hypothetical protein